MIKHKEASETIGNELVTIDRRRSDRRARKDDAGPKPLLNQPQKKANRRRHIDPTMRERLSPRRNRFHASHGRLQACFGTYVPNLQRGARSGAWDGFTFD